MSRTFAHQDACGTAGLPLGVFNRDGNEVPVPEGDDPASFAQQHGYEALVRCMNHPDTPAVDCTICDPMEDSP